MPELPEVETVRRELEPWLLGRTIVKAARLEAPPGPKYVGLERAAGQRVEAVGRRGKFLILPLSSGDDLIIHLGMTGIISPRDPGRHVRVTLDLEGDPDPRLYFQDVRRFGRFLVVPSGDYRSLPTLHAMGPEPLTDAFNPAQLEAAFKKASVAVKTYLLSQKPVSGVGNIYADEALWASKIHPLTPANRVPKRQIPLLVTMLKDVLTASIEVQGTTLRDYRTVNGEVGAYLDELNAYGQKEEPCPRCGTPISKIVVAGRGTHFCPKCQKLPRAR
ncbi:DNA-formamidopyrimidine glycosylase [soil metagenome]